MPITPTKEKFIRAKYGELKYVCRPLQEDISDLDMQLFSCVRTSHVDTTLRLLAQRANPTFINLTTGDTPLHIAAKERQLRQIELLCMYGANLFGRNNNGDTPRQLAERCGFDEIAHRLIQLEFEIPDRMSWFLCGKIPTHQNDHHFLIPDVVGAQLTEKQKAMMERYVHLTDDAFASLGEDLYDEIERRNNSKAWCSEVREKHNILGAVQYLAAFLPPNPLLPSFRNQRRQKLAKFDSNGFVHLLIIHLKEMRRRFYGIDKKVILKELKDRNVIDKHPKTTTHPPQINQKNEEEEENENKLSKAEQYKRSIHRTQSATTENQRTYSKDIDDLQSVIKKQTETINNLSQLVVTFSREMKGVQVKMDTMEVDNAALRDDLSRLRSHVYLKDTQFGPQTNVFAPKAMHATPLSSYTLEKNKSGPINGTCQPTAQDNDSAFSSRTIDYQEKSSVMTTGMQVRRGNSFANHSNELLSSPQHTIPTKFQMDFRGKMIQNVDKLTLSIRNLQTELLKPTPQSFVYCDAISNCVNCIIDTIPKSVLRKSVLACIQKLENSMRRLECICVGPNINVHDASMAAYQLALAAKNLFLCCE
uniref:ANK_REP_REGION domain-containing protein n=1 Tax=Rhabditophanes sp. KR3021 TaxID=114890 RepID=A0AC35TY49_9BILA